MGLDWALGWEVVVPLGLWVVPLGLWVLPLWLWVGLLRPWEVLWEWWGWDCGYSRTGNGGNRACQSALGCRPDLKTLLLSSWPWGWRGLG